MIKSQQPFTNLSHFPRIFFRTLNNIELVRNLHPNVHKKFSNPRLYKMIKALYLRCRNSVLLESYLEKEEGS